MTEIFAFEKQRGAVAFIAPKWLGLKLRVSAAERVSISARAPEGAEESLANAL